MMNIFFRRIIKHTRGFTLVEVLIAVAITSLIMGGITTSIIQLMSISDQNTNAITAQRQLQQVGYNMSRDGQNSQEINIDPDSATGFPVVFIWINWAGEEHEVVYTITNGLMEREEYIDGDLDSSRSVATDISLIGTLFSATTNPAGDDLSGLNDSLFHLTIASNIDGLLPVSETRYYEIKLRATT